VKNHAAVTPTYREFPSDASLLLWVWRQYGPEGEVCHYLRARFEAATTEVDDFLATFFPIERGGLPAAIAGDRYRAEAHLINPKFILSRLREHYGLELDDPRFDLEGDLPPARRIAHEFARIHNATEGENVGCASTQTSSDADPQGCDHFQQVDSTDAG
jgi:hypothetical protein